MDLIRSWRLATFELISSEHSPNSRRRESFKNSLKRAKSKSKNRCTKPAWARASSSWCADFYVVCDGGVQDLRSQTTSIRYATAATSYARLSPPSILKDNGDLRVNVLCCETRARPGCLQDLGRSARAGVPLPKLRPPQLQNTGCGGAIRPYRTLVATLENHRRLQG